MRDIKSDVFTMLMNWFNSMMKNIKFDAFTTLMKIIFALSFLCFNDVFLK